jgi:hypothetical protein
MVTESAFADSYPEGLPVVNGLQTQNFDHKWQPHPIFGHAASQHISLFTWINKGLQIVWFGEFLKTASPLIVGILWHPSGI